MKCFYSAIIVFMTFLKCKQFCYLAGVFFPSYLPCVFRRLKFLWRCNTFYCISWHRRKKALLSHPNIIIATTLHWKNGLSQFISFLSEVPFKVLTIYCQTLSSTDIEGRVLSPDLSSTWSSTSLFLTKLKPKKPKSMQPGGVLVLVWFFPNKSTYLGILSSRMEKQN